MESVMIPFFHHPLMLVLIRISTSLYLQSSVLHSQPKSTVGTPAYIAPEVLLKKEYDGKVFKCPFALWTIHTFLGHIMDYLTCI